MENPIITLAQKIALLKRSRAAQTRIMPLESMRKVTVFLDNEDADADPARRELQQFFKPYGVELRFICPQKWELNWYGKYKKAKPLKGEKPEDIDDDLFLCLAQAGNFAAVYEAKHSNAKFKVGIHQLMNETTAGVYHNKTKTLFMQSEVIEKIREKNFNNDNKYDNGLSFLLHACFHELEHRLQAEYPQLLTNQKDIYLMMYKIEQILITILQYEHKYDEYDKIHENFLLEIDADIKGNKNSKTFAEKYQLPINQNYIELFNYYNIFRENNYEPTYFINQFNKKIKKYYKHFQTFIENGSFEQRKITDFYDNNGNLKSIDEIMNLKENPLLPYVVSSTDFIQSINNKKLNENQIIFIYNNIRIVIDEHKDKQIKSKAAKEILEPRFNEFIEYTKVYDSPSLKSLKS